MDEGSDSFLVDAADERIDRNDATHVGLGGSRVVVDDFEVGVVDDELATAHLGLPVDDELVSDRDDLLNVGEAEPTQDNAIAEQVAAGGRFNRGLEPAFPPSPSEAGLRIDHLNVQADRFFRRVFRKGAEVSAILVAARVVAERVAHGAQAHFLEAFRCLLVETNQSGFGEQGIKGEHAVGDGLSISSRVKEQREREGRRTQVVLGSCRSSALSWCRSRGERSSGSDQRHRIPGRC